MYSCGPLHMDEQRQDDQLEPTYSSSVLIRGAALRTCQKQWTIERGGKRGSGISMLIAWHDDNDDDVGTGQKKSQCIAIHFVTFSHKMQGFSFTFFNANNMKNWFENVNMDKILPFLRLIKLYQKLRRWIWWVS